MEPFITHGWSQSSMKEKESYDLSKSTTSALICQNKNLLTRNHFQKKLFTNLINWHKDVSPFLKSTIFFCLDDESCNAFVGSIILWGSITVTP